MAENIGTAADGVERKIVICPLCQQADDHPRHRITTDDPFVSKHIDCCREAGCPDGTCEVLLDGVDNPKPGLAMWKHVQKVHDERDVEQEKRALQNDNPSLLEFTVPGQTPIQLTQTDFRNGA